MRAIALVAFHITPADSRQSCPERPTPLGGAFVTNRLVGCASSTPGVVDLKSRMYFRPGRPTEIKLKECGSIGECVANAALVGRFKYCLDSVMRLRQRVCVATNVKDHLHRYTAG